MKRGLEAILAVAVLGTISATAFGEDWADKYGTTPTAVPTMDAAATQSGLNLGAPETAVKNTDPFAPRQPTYALPVAQERSDTTFKEEELVGSYKQPRWTTSRFSTRTRIYVIPEGKVEVEYWAMPRWHNNSSEVDLRQLFEVEIGLGHRLQLDLYFRTDTDFNTNDDKTLVGGQFEIRYALADWNVIPGNPTLYFEYIQLEDRANRIEPKLLFGGELAPGYHWGVNFIWEQEIGNSDKGENETELEMTGVLMYSFVDEKFSAGVEIDLDVSNVKGERSDWGVSFMVGPTFRWKPMPQVTVNLCPLFGTTDDSADCRVIFNIGYEFQ